MLPDDRPLTRDEGVLAGGSAGAAVAGAVRYAEQVDAAGLPAQNIVVLLPDGAKSICRRSSTTTGCAITAFGHRRSDGHGVGSFAQPLDPPDCLAERTATLRQVIALLKGTASRRCRWSIRPPLRVGGRGRSAESPAGQRWLADETIEPIIEADYATVTPSTKIACSRPSSTMPRWSACCRPVTQTARPRRRSRRMRCSA